jgi:hypothetical protein
MKWQYKVEDGLGTKNGPDLQTHLNMLGAEGWELIAVMPLDRTPVHTLYIFKRQTQ